MIMLLAVVAWDYGKINAIAFPQKRRLNSAILIDS
jgi:hypothetical protein